MASNLHFGSRLVFGRDGTLFVTQGDRSIIPGRMQAQKLGSGLGKIVRINPDGAIYLLTDSATGRLLKHVPKK